MLNEDFSHIYDKEFSDKNMKTILRIQQKVKAYIDRKRFLDIKQRINEGNEQNKYFTREEANETLNKEETIEYKLYSKGKCKLQKREPYTYKCTKAIYDGEWIGGKQNKDGEWVGGMRHGCGTMVWPDGA